MITYLSIVGSAAKATALAKERGLPVVLHSIYSGGVYLPDGRAITPKLRYAPACTRLTYGADLVRTLVEAGLVGEARIELERFSTISPENANLIPEDGFREVVLKHPHAWNLICDRDLIPVIYPD